MKKFICSIPFLFLGFFCFSQPWLGHLTICQSTNGTSFTNQQLFVDSAGVPTIVKDTAGRLIAAFQWFPMPFQANANWDQVAIKISTDNGLTWSSPTRAVFNGIGTMQRPFDPTLAIADDGRIRMYFSSSAVPAMSLDSSVHTYSAISTDGINYTVESGWRVRVADSANIDPAVVKLNGVWHYTSPRGAPQDGAFHFTSSDGLNFTRSSDIVSDNQHQWTGNLNIDGSNMNFYGCGPNPIWFKSTTDGNTWTSPVNTNINGGDPAVIKVSAGVYFMIFVGASTTDVTENNVVNLFSLFPNPASEQLYLHSEIYRHCQLLNCEGQTIKEFEIDGNYSLDVSDLAPGIYFIRDIENGISQRFIRE